MPDDASAYAALGLEPDADSAQIERAYKRLIKEHHPDRAGGDARRAAELKRAYRELRSGRDLKSDLDFNDEWPDAASSRSRGWAAFGLMAVAGAVALLLVMGPLGLAADALRPAVLHRFAAARDRAGPADPMDQP